MCTSLDRRYMYMLYNRSLASSGKVEVVQAAGLVNETRAFVKLNFKLRPHVHREFLYIQNPHTMGLIALEKNAPGRNKTLCDCRNATEEGWRSQRRGRKRQKQEEQSAYGRRSKHALTGSVFL